MDMTLEQFEIEWARGVAACSIAAQGLWIRAFMWSRANKTDGILSRRDLEGLADGLDDVNDLAGELVAARAWVPVADGIAFAGVDPKVEQRRRAEATRAARYRERRRGDTRSPADTIASPMDGSDASRTVTRHAHPEKGGVTRHAHPLEVPDQVELFAPAHDPLRAGARAKIYTPSGSKNPARKSSGNVSVVIPRGQRPWRCVPAGEALTPRRREMATTARLPGDRIELEWAKYVDHRFASPRESVDATWRNWVREAVDRLQSRRGPSGPEERMAATIEAGRRFVEGRQ